MEESYKIISELLRLTELMNEGLKSNDIDIVIEMLNKRRPLIELLSGLDQSTFNSSVKEKVRRLLILDEENNELLKTLSDEMKEVIGKMEYKKAAARKSNKVAKRYLSDGVSNFNYSKFNKKT